MCAVRFFYGKEKGFGQPAVFWRPFWLPPCGEKSKYAILPLGQKGAYRAKNDPYVREEPWILRFLVRFL